VSETREVIKLLDSSENFVLEMESLFLVKFGRLKVR